MPYGPGTYGSKVGRPKKKNKKLSPKQKKMASLGGNPNKIDASDLKHPTSSEDALMAHKGKGSCGGKKGGKGYKK